MPNPNPNPEQVLAQKEVAINVLRDPAMQKLLLEGVESAYTSQVTRSARGLEIKTVDDKKHTNSDILIGNCDPSHGLTSMSADVPVTNWSKQVQEKDHIDFSYGLFDRSDKGHVEVNRTDSKGQAIQTSVGDYNQLDHGHIGRTTEADYVVKDARLQKLGELKLNQVVTHIFDGRDEYRSVIRDKNDRVLGIVDQIFDTNSKGDLVKVQTWARKSKYQGQVVHPEQ